MPCAKNSGIRLHYEVEGEGPPLVLQHGRGGSLSEFRDMGYVEGLRNDYQLVLPDARGHERSDKPHDPDAYRLRLRAMDVVAVLGDLGTAKAHCLGQSYGAYTGWGIAKYVPQRFHSFILMGGDRPVVHDPDVHGEDIPLWEQGVEAVIPALRPWFREKWTPSWEGRYLDNDPEAQIAALLVREELDFEDVRQNLDVPLLSITDELSATQEGTEFIRTMPNARFVSIPGLDNLSASFRTDLILPHIRRFLAEVGEG